MAQPGLKSGSLATAVQMINIQRSVSMNIFLNEKENTRNCKPYSKHWNYVSKVS